MKRILFVLISMIVIACGADTGTVTTSPRERNALQQPQQAPQPSATPIPSPTIGWMATAQVAQQTADASMRIAIEETAAEAERNQVRLSWTAAADQMTWQASMLTAQSDASTSTAALTYIPLTSTQQIINQKNVYTQQADLRTQLAATQSAPTLIVAMAKAEAQAKYADANEKAYVGFVVAVAFFIFVLSIIMLGFVFMNMKVRVKEQPQEDAEPFVFEDQRPVEKDVQFVRIEPDVDYRLRAVVPCPEDILLEIADGIINRRMTLAFNLWEGTEVHKHLKDIREFMVAHHFAKLVRGQNGALDILAKGESFLLETISLGRPPAPYQCRA